MNKKRSYIDLHTHHDHKVNSGFAIRSFHQKEKALFEKHEGPCSIGLHPWFITEHNLEQDLIWLAENVHQNKVKFIGEAGLDKLKGPSLSIQDQAFKAQVSIAAKNKKPIIVHCVKAFNELVRLKKSIAHTPPMIIHSFKRKFSLMESLLSHGFFISFGAAILKDNAPAVECLKNIEASRFFLETDESPESIEAIYTRAAGIRGLSLEELMEAIERNYIDIIES